MKILKSFLIFLLLTCAAQATIIRIPANQPSIQAGINTAIEGDTILVAPGIYVENINYKGKSIVVGSLLLTTGDTSYISQTVIDGNRTGSIVTIVGGDSTSVLCGFTITHGKSDGGAGITCSNSSPTLSNLKITENTATQGAGIFITNSKLKLVNSIITNNRAELYGGGLHASDSSPLIENVIIAGNIAEGSGGGCIFYSSKPHFKNVTVKKNAAYYNCGGIGIYFSDAIFDSVKRCNIYQNYAGRGCDVDYFNLDEGNSDITLYADTFTVINPTNYHVSRLNKFNILHGKIQQSNTDLYINLSGSDENSGESPDKPLRTISYALSKIYADSLNPHSIYISAGVYTRSQGEYFPLNVVDYASLKGVSADSVILDAEGITGVLSFSSAFGNYIEDLTITRGYRYEGGGIYCENSSPSLIKIAITGNTAMSCGGGMACSEYSYPVLENCTISNNQAEGGMGGGIYMLQSCASLVNTILWDNIPDEVYFSRAGYDKSCMEFAYTDVMDSTNRVVTNNNGDVYWHDGNFNLNPLFCQPDSGIYSLAENSPCIGAGKDGENIGALCVGCADLEIENESVILPDKFILYQNYPNPFNPTTTISFCLPQIEVVKLSIYDINGHLVETLVNKRMEPGYHSVKWNGENFSSGVYLYKIVAGNFSATGKCLLLK